jgi:YjbE family integral membrane protein
MPDFLLDSGFWVSVAQIIAIDILLGGDNAVVIALACRRLPEKQRNQVIFWGVFGAVALRVVLIFFALQLLALPYLKIVGALLLVWIGIKLLQPEEGDAHGKIEGSTHLLGAIKTIIVADAVMSLDNVIAVAGAARGDIVLVIFGIAVSIPIIVWGSRFVLKLMDRFPVVITLGGALLGWIAGEMSLGDVVIEPLVAGYPGWLKYAAAAAGALIVVLTGTWLAGRVQARIGARPVVDLATAGDQVAAPAIAAPGLRFLLAADDSEPAIRAVENFIRQFAWYRQPVELHLLNTQRAVQGDVSAFVDENQLKEFHHEEAMKALQPARERLGKAHIPYILHIGVGNPPQVIAQYAKEKECQQIFMSEHAGTASEGLLGSVATEVVRLSDVPVVLV